MTQPESLRVFVDARGVDVPRGAKAIDAVQAYDPAAAAAVRGGEKILTDSRGLAVDAASAIESGAIFRLILKRDRSAKPASE